MGQIVVIGRERMRDLAGALCRHITALAVLLTIASPVYAQFHFDSWTADSGLPQNIVTAIRQTRDGYLWIATFDGLARFDGVRFTVFNRANSPGIYSNRFTSLFEDTRGDLWMGTEIGAVTRYTGGRFITYSAPNGLSARFVRAFSGDAAGNVWVLSDDTIRQWQPDGERFVEIGAPVVPGGYKRLDWTETGGVWGTDHGELLLFVNGRLEHRALPASPSGQLGFVALAQDETIWLSYSGGRVVRLPASTDDGGAPAEAPPAIETLPAGVARQTTWRDRHGTRWTLRVNESLGRSLTLGGAGRAETVVFGSLCEDREGNLWLGTDGQGLRRVRKQVVVTYSKPEGLLDGNIYPIYEDRAGAIWIGVWSGGLSRLQAGTFTNYTMKDGLAPGAVTSLTEDREGTLWVGTSSGVQLFRDGRFTPLIPNLNAGGTVNVVHQDRDGVMWLGTDRGLIRYANGTATLFTSRDGLPGDTVRVLIDTRDGLWIGVYGGLARWKDGKFTSWTDRDGMPGSTVRALYEDRQGVLWIGTYDSGLGRFQDGRFTRYTTRDGLFNDGVFQILEDSRGNLWMSSNRGISRVRKQELDDVAAGRRRSISSVAYGKADGMANVECNGGLWPAGYRSHDGRLWFPTQDGAAVIDPDSITDQRNPPRVVIESLQIDREAVIASRMSAPVRIGPEWQNLEIQYTGLSFSDPEHMRFRYKLAGLDHDWVEAGTRRTAVLFAHAAWPVRVHRRGGTS